MSKSAGLPDGTKLAVTSSLQNKTASGEPTAPQSFSLHLDKDLQIFRAKVPMSRIINHEPPTQAALVPAATGTFDLPASLARKVLTFLPIEALPDAAAYLPDAAATVSELLAAAL